MRRLIAGLPLLLAFACGALPGPADEAAGHWVVVASPGFRPALTPLVEHRRSEGFKVVVVETTEALDTEQLRQGVGAPLQRRLDDLFQHQKGPKYLLLAGVFGGPVRTNLDAVVPALRGATGRMKDRAGDAGYGLPCADGAPTVAVGRFPARTAEEVSAMVRKTLSFEQDLQAAPWRNRLLLLVGDPHGGPLADKFVEDQLARDLASLHPSWELRTLINISSSRYFLPKPRDRETALHYLGEGQIFSIYLGHSNAEDVDARFVRRSDLRKMNIPRGNGPFFSCGCFGCEFNGKGDGYGVAAMRNPAGPVAVMGSTGESYAAPGQLAVEGLLTCLTRTPFPARLADYWLGVQAGLARGKIDAASFLLLDMVDGTGGRVPLATQRLEHLEMWMLLGDPALRLPIVPADISLKAAMPVGAGKTLTINGLLPNRLNGATVRVALERPLASAPIDLKDVPPNPNENREAREKALIANHQRANSFVLTSAEATAAVEHFTVSLNVPADVPWPSVVIRASATLSNETGIAAIELPVTRSR